jgi:hypothetical protein
MLPELPLKIPWSERLMMGLLIAGGKKEKGKERKKKAPQGERTM